MVTNLLAGLMGARWGIKSTLLTGVLVVLVEGGGEPQNVRVLCACPPFLGPAAPHSLHHTHCRHPSSGLTLQLAGIGMLFGWQVMI